MQNSSFTPQFTQIWAENATTDTLTYPIPSTSSVSGRAALGSGFTTTNMTPIAAGGIPPFGQDFNGILKMLSVTAQNYEAGNVPVWSSDFATALNGYPKYALVQYGGLFYVSTVDGNGTTPGADGADWKSLFDGLATQLWADGQFATITQLQDEASTRSSADASLSSAIQSETTARTTADTALQSAITAETARAEASEASKANLAGGNSFSGDQLVDGGAIYLKNGHREVFYSSDTGSDPGSYFEITSVNEGTIQALLRLVNSSGITQAYWYLNADGTITGTAGTVALLSDFASGSTGDSGYYNRVGSVLTQQFQTVGITSTAVWVSFPITFSDTPAPPTGNVYGSGDQDTQIYGATASGCYVRCPSGSQTQNQPVSIIVMGPA